MVGCCCCVLSSHFSICMDWNFNVYTNININQSVEIQFFILCHWNLKEKNYLKKLNTVARRSYFNRCNWKTIKNCEKKWVENKKKHFFPLVIIKLLLKQWSNNSSCTFKSSHIGFVVVVVGFWFCWYFSSLKILFIFLNKNLFKKIKRKTGTYRTQSIHNFHQCSVFSQYTECCVWSKQRQVLFFSFIWMWMKWKL